LASDAERHNQHKSFGRSSDGPNNPLLKAKGKRVGWLPVKNCSLADGSERPPEEQEPSIRAIPPTSTTEQQMVKPMQKEATTGLIFPKSVHGHATSRNFIVVTSATDVEAEP
jgi:hypothetical protein